MPQPERGHQIGELLVLEHLGERHALGVHHLAAQRQDRLPRAVASLLGGSAGGIAFDDEQLAVVAMRGRAVTELARQVEAAGRRRLARDFRLRGAAGLARARREDDAPDDRFGDRPVVIQPVLERGPDRGIDRRQHLGIVQAILGLPLELRLLDEQAEHAGQAFADVFGGERHALRRQVVRLDVVAHGLADAGAQPVFVRAAGSGWECR